MATPGEGADASSADIAGCTVVDPLQALFNELPPPDRGPALQVAVWLWTASALGFLCTRLYCKFCRYRRIHLDDMILIFSWFCLLGSAISTLFEIVMFRFGKHTTMEPITNLKLLQALGNLSITFTTVSLAASKTSWALTLSQLTYGWTRRGIWLSIVPSNLLFVATSLVYWLGCVSGKCLSPRVGMYMSIVASVYSGVMDLAFAILPWQILQSLDAERKDKLGAAVAMSMGVFAAIAAFVKCSVMPTLLSLDFSFDGPVLAFWGFAEMSITIMAASTPMVWVLLRMNSKKNSKV